MAETRQFVVEGDMTLAYFIDERDSKHILISEQSDPNDPCADPSCARRLEAYIADQLGFPSDSEFDAMLKHIEDLRKRGLRPAVGQPDGKRERVRLRVTVEIL